MIVTMTEWIYDCMHLRAAIIYRHDLFEGSVFVFHVSLYAFVCCNDIVH